MSPYRLQYNESESNIKIYNLLCKNTNNAKTVSNSLIFSKIEQFKKLKILLCIMYKFHNSYFIILYVYISIYLYFYIFIYLYIYLIYQFISYLIN